MLIFVVLNNKNNKMSKRKVEHVEGNYLYGKYKDGSSWQTPNFYGAKVGDIIESDFDVNSQSYFDVKLNGLDITQTFNQRRYAHQRALIEFSKERKNR